MKWPPPGSLVYNTIWSKPAEVTLKGLAKHKVHMSFLSSGPQCSIVLSQKPEDESAAFDIQHWKDESEATLTEKKKTQ